MTTGGVRPYRIGHLYPSGGISEHELYRMAPEQARFLTTRLVFRRSGMDDCRRLFDEMEGPLGLLADAKVDLIAVNCTVATLMAGASALNQRVREATGVPSVTTIEAVLAALAALSMKRVALLTPYQESVVQAETAFLAGQGVSVVAAAGRACRHPVEQGEIPAEFWYSEGLRLADSDCDGLLISCAGIQVASILERLESVWQRPVVASNQALVWFCLQRLGIDSSGLPFGSLMRY